VNGEAYNQKVLAALEAIQKDVAFIKSQMSASGGAGGGGGGEVADVRDLDGQHGDPTIKYDPKPKYWEGSSYIGYRFSETEPDYLDAQAKYLDACAYMADKDQDEKKRSGARFKRKDAARARGWAARLRSGWTAPTFGGGGAGARPPRAADVGGTDGKGSDDFGFGDNDADIPFATSLPNRRGL
jgi:hypothetical protein